MATTDPLTGDLLPNAVPLAPNWAAIACEEKRYRSVLEVQVAELRKLVAELSLRPPIEAYERLEAELTAARSAMHDDDAIMQGHNIPTLALRFSR